MSTTNYVRERCDVCGREMDTPAVERAYLLLAVDIRGTPLRPALSKTGRPLLARLRRAMAGTGGHARDGEDHSAGGRTLARRCTQGLREG